MQNDSLNHESWLAKAEDDIRWAVHDLQGGFYEQTCFISQQIIEKTLKAFLLFHKKPLRKIHDLAALLENCVQINSSFSSFQEECDKITQFYVETRYPGVRIAVDEKDAAEALSAAKGIFNFVKQKIGEK